MAGLVASASGATAAGLKPAGAMGLAALALAMLMPSLATSIANAALPALAAAFDASFQAVQWIVLSYLLAITALVVAAGRLGDLYGRRRVLMAGIVLFTAASLLCGCAPSLWLLVAARAVQGAGAAMMMALAMAMVGDTVPSAKVGAAMGLLGTMSAVGTSLGPSLGGALIATIGWPPIFLVNVPLGVIALALAWRGLPADRVALRGVAGLDWGGALLLLAALTGYALAMTQRSFGIVATILLTAAGAAGVAFVRYEARVPQPLIALGLFRDHALRSGLAANLLVATVMMATLVVGSFYLAVGLELKAAAIGLVLSVGPLVAALSGAPAGRLVDRLGARRVSLGGLAGMVVGASLLSVLAGQSGMIGYLGPMILLTAGYATFQAGNNALVMMRAGASERGLVSGLLNLSRNLGLISGASVKGAVFALFAGDPATAGADAISRGMQWTFALGAVLIAIAIGLLAKGGMGGSGAGAARPASR